MVVRENSVLVCLSVSLFNGSWVGCCTFFSPYSQCWCRRLIHVCIQKVYLRGKHFIIHSLWNQWLIVFSLSETWSTSWLHPPCAGAGKVGALKARKGVASGRKANTSRLLALMFPLGRFFPFFILERKWAKGQLLSDWHMCKPWVILRESSVIIDTHWAFAWEKNFQLSDPVKAIRKSI